MKRFLQRWIFGVVMLLGIPVFLLIVVPVAIADVKYAENVIERGWEVFREIAGLNE